MEQMYKSRKIEALLDRVVVIPNAVEIPEKYPDKPKNERLRVLFVSRNSPEKRPQVIGKIASECTRRGYPTDLFLVGDLIDGIEKPDRSNCNFIGEVHDDAILTEEYVASDLILIVSQYEGFPMTVMEAMAHGVVPIATNVGGIPDHINPDNTGVLIHSISEEDIINDACDAIHRFIRDRELLTKLSRNCYEYAKANFSKGVFCENYSKLIGSL